MDAEARSCVERRVMRDVPCDVRTALGPQCRVGDLVLAWGRRVARVQRWARGSRLLVLLDGDDPPTGYNANWPLGEIEPLQPRDERARW